MIILSYKLIKNNLVYFNSIMEPTDGLKLELVQILFRHGARSCTKAEADIPMPIYIDKKFQDYHGCGQLTNLGKSQMYDLGRALRNRYINFLSSKYSSDDLYAYTTDHERTKMSLQLVLAGLYPPVFDQIWHPNLNWLPIPFHYVPKELDILLKGCEMPKYNQHFTDVKNSPSFQNLTAEAMKLNDFFEDKAIYVIKKYGLLAIFGIYNVLSCHKVAQASLPYWYTDELFETLKTFVIRYFDMRSSTLQLKKYFAGPLIKRLIENMNIKDELFNPRKIYLYSAHELNIAAFTRAHNIETFKYPYFGSAVILEKFRDSHNQLHVRLLCWNGKDDKFINLLLGGNEFCPMDEYLKITKNIIPSENEINSMFKDCIKTNLQNVHTTDYVYRPKYKDFA